MTTPSYAGARLDMATAAGKTAMVRDLQDHMRKLGYFNGPIDGKFGGMTELAVKSLKHDLLNNDGNGKDGRAAVKLRDYNQARVAAVDGTVDDGLVGCIADMLGDQAFCKVPFSPNPAQDNQRIREVVAALRPEDAPMPFLVAIFRQESDFQHYREPSTSNSDAHVVLGLDRNPEIKHVITSRGYGMGQYTIFHHPPRAEEVAGFIQDPRQNVQRAVRELKEKFDHFVLGPTGEQTADDRVAERGKTLPLRPCSYPKSDPRYLKDCLKCAQAAGKQDIKAADPVYAGAALKFEPTQYYTEADHPGTPVRKNFPCDWPYALRRYNGSGVNSYHYQAKVLGNLLKG